MQHVHARKPRTDDCYIDAFGGSSHASIVADDGYGEVIASPRLIDHMRGVRYGEIIPLFMRDGSLVADVYGTQLLNDCPQELWETLDPVAIAAELGALGAKLNGPRYWVLDGFGTKVAPVEPVLREFNGLLMRRIAQIDLGTQPQVATYLERRVDRGAVFFWDAGKPVFELVRPEIGRAHV